MTLIPDHYPYPQPSLGRCQYLIEKALSEGTTVKQIAERVGVAGSVISRIRHTDPQTGMLPLTVARVAAAAVGELDYIQDEALFMCRAGVRAVDLVKRLTNSLEERELNAALIAPIVLHIYNHHQERPHT